MSHLLYGSICLSNIPKELIKEIQCKDGVTRKYLDLSVVERKEPSNYGHTHFISCAPKKENRKEGVNYIIGDLKTYTGPSAPTSENAGAQKPNIETNDDLPF